MTGKTVGLVLMVAGVAIGTKFIHIGAILFYVGLIALAVSV